MRQLILLFLTCLGCMGSLLAQPDRWQQRVKYKMDIKMDVTTNRFTGTQQLEYINNSPDTLKRVFYHLYWNAFQPNSMMDVRSRELGKINVGGRPDWDGRVRDRILNLKEDEIGYQKVETLTMNGVAQQLILHETILEVVLSKPILPRSKVVFDMSFSAQVPLQVRRSGRDNPMTGVRYSMSQWYPKLCEYDYEGWHTDPYVAREFYGVWGDFDVNITIDKHYLIGATGYLQNPNQIGYGYETKGATVTRPAGNTLTWRFLAPNVHDFVWAADPEYGHITRQVPNGPTIHVIYNRDVEKLTAAYQALKEGEKARLKNDVQLYLKQYDVQWERIADAAVTVLPFIEKKFGSYPYKQYSFIHGGDGGMEYPMATLISSASLGTAFHEWMHSWYQMMLATNESEYGWMDEGFTSYAETLVSDYYQAVLAMKQTQGKSTLSQAVLDSLAETISVPTRNSHDGAYRGYFDLVKSGLEEPLTTHADHFETNAAYSIASYSKGEVFMEQLGYIVGAKTRDEILLEYYRQWRYKHPNVHDFIRVAEKVSDIKLDWYKEYFVYTTKSINYGIDSMWQDGSKTKIRLKRIGYMPMPIDLQLTLKDGAKQMEYIPMYLMFGAKQPEYEGMATTTHPAWKWTDPYYVVEVDRKLMDIQSVEIDPSQRMADVDRANNKLQIQW